MFPIMYLPTKHAYGIFIDPINLGINKLKISLKSVKTFLIPCISETKRFSTYVYKEKNCLFSGLLLLLYLDIEISKLLSCPKLPKEMKY